MVADAAHSLATKALDIGDPELATWATRQGHLASPSQLALFEMRLTARGMAGDIGGVRHTLDEARRAVTELDPLDDIPESTARAYEHAIELARRAPAAAP
jgi:hypothetical protein